MNLSDKSILVTGGAGFVGSNIVEHLLSNNVKFVRIVDNLSTGNKQNIQPFLEKYPNFEFLYGDISNIDICRQAVKDIDIICHQAALGSVPRSVKDPLTVHHSNVDGFINLLVTAKEHGIKRVVYASSSSIYGDNMILPKVEKNTGNVLSPYAATKLVNEIYAGIFTRCYGMECIGLRYFNIFGKRQDPNGVYASVIPKFIDLIKNGQSPTINGDGSYFRDFTHIENAVQANCLAMTTTNTECFGQIFNIGAGGKTTILELFNIVNEYYQANLSPIFGPIRPGDVPYSIADIDKASRMLGYQPLVNFKDGIIKTIEYYSN